MAIRTISIGPLENVLQYDDAEDAPIRCDEETSEDTALMYSAARQGYVPRTLTYVREKVAGVSAHNDLTSRDAANAHPISAVTGLQSALDEKETSGAAAAAIASHETDYNHSLLGADSGGASSYVFQFSPDSWIYGEPTFTLAGAAKRVMGAASPYALFEDDADQAAQLPPIIVPSEYGDGTGWEIVATMHATSTATSGNLRFGFLARSIAAGENPLTKAFDDIDMISATAVNGTAGNVVVLSKTIDTAKLDGVQGGERLDICPQRNASSDSADTCEAEARVFFCEIKIQRSE